ncbi:hypothetical protein MATL_G00117990 [Megalops atlanticus]|uniref:VLIG-type G domain-containing protein n=1 Tax=Megalops atlanticus TaxID=7932 RepID=A0A9D3PZM6_MEGAT|nr:hypothetical protein MATL_G00117990 [Megalops atlanticus]
MSVHRKRLSLSRKSKRRKSAEERALENVLQQLGLEVHQTEPLGLASMLEISTWNPGDSSPQAPTDLPRAFLRRLWLLSPETRSPCCQSLTDALGDATREEGLPGLGEDSQCPVNPLDLVSAVYVSTDSLLHQEISVRMAQCRFAVPLVMPPNGPDGKATFLLWPLRAVMRQWRPHSVTEVGGLLEGDIASAQMPLLSFVRLGHCSVSKSRVLNRVLSGSQEADNYFLHRGMDGGQLPRRLSDGLVEVSWYLPSGNRDLDVFPEAVMVANLRGDATTSPTTFEAQVQLLCRNSSAILVFCGALGEKERHLLASWKDSTSRIFLIMCSEMEEKEEAEKGKGESMHKLIEELKLPEEAMVSCSSLGDEEELMNRLREAVICLLQDSLRSVSLVAVAEDAHKLNITVDEGETCRMALTLVEEVLKGIEEQGVSKYKEEQLPLQGQLWKKLMHMEKEECQQNGASLEQRKQELQKEKESLYQEQTKYEMTAAMKGFIGALSTSDKLERAFFLDWMRLKLNTLSLQKLTPPQQLITEQQEATADGQDRQTGDPDENVELDKPNLAFALGLEDFTREMGLIFELSQLSPGNASKSVTRLPALAADLLLCGQPLELLDGGASTMPLQWVGSVLSEVHRRLPHDSQVRVLTVLGLQTARNAAVLSALLGLSFHIGSSQHTRGAFMLLIGVPQNLRKELGCDFLLLINTEGLQCIDLGESFGCDNELATIVTGLSDITLVNLPAEGEPEIHSTLRMVVNALLHVKEKGRMPLYKVVAQDDNVDTKVLVLQLGRVIQILTAGEKKMTSSCLDDLQECKADAKYQCLLGPWQKNHPMAPVAPGYSKAVLGLKQTLLATLRKCANSTPSTSLPELMERMSSMWEAVQYEKFSFGLRDAKVAEAFCSLCAEFSHWERTFRGHMESWVEAAEERISAFEGTTPGNGGVDGPQSLEDLLRSLKEEAEEEVASEADKVLSSLVEYFKREDSNLSLMQNYRANFISTLGALKDQVARELNEKIEITTERHGTATKIRDFQTVLKAALEIQMQSILERQKTNEAILEDKQLEEEFVNVWSETVSKLNLKPLETQDITSKVIEQLRENLSKRGIKKHLDKLVNVTNGGTSTFAVDEEHFGFRSRVRHKFAEDNTMEAQRIADRAIEDCNKYVLQKKCLKTDYFDNYTKELLEIVDEALAAKQFEIKSKFEVELKVHICASAAHSFQEMHKSFTRERDVLRHLEKTREQHFWEFLYQFRKSDQCRKAARVFIALCLKPALLDYIHRPLGSLILEQMLSEEAAHHYSSRQSFHFNLLKELLLEDNFQGFLDYLLGHYSFIRRRIHDQVVAHVSKTALLEDWWQCRLEQIAEQIEGAVRTAGDGWRGEQMNASLLLEKVCDGLESGGDLTISRDILRGPLFQIITPRCHFVECLLESLAEMHQSLKLEFSQRGNTTQAIADVLQALPFKPQDELYHRVKGCEQQCPFCKAPCDAGGGEHTVHRTLLHRPKGLVSYTCAGSSSLSPTTCPSDIAGGNLFLNQDTDGKSFRYKDYRSVYPDWSIPPEDPGSDGALSYWRHVLVRYNERFAQEYWREPAQLLETWRNITQEEAIQSLRGAST